MIRIAPSEWEVMEVVWDRSPIAATDVTGALQKRKDWSLATVRTLLRRLVRKGALRQESEGKRFLFTPVVSEQDCIQLESESFLDRVLGRTPPSTILRLVRGTDLSKKDIQDLRKILREKEQK